MTPMLPTPANEYDDDAIVNTSTNPHIQDIMASRLSRRGALRGGVSVTAGVLLGGMGLTACGGGNSSPTIVPTPTPEPGPVTKPLALGFTAVAKN